jgi:hypothetical protein
MNNVVFDWLDLTVILSTITACAVVGWFASRLMNRFEAIQQIEPVAPAVDVQQIEVSVVDRGWRRWRRIAKTEIKVTDGIYGCDLPDENIEKQVFNNQASDSSAGWLMSMIICKAAWEAGENLCHKFVRDITERKATDKALREATEAAEAAAFVRAESRRPTSHGRRSTLPINCPDLSSACKDLRGRSAERLNEGE